MNRFLCETGPTLAQFYDRAHWSEATARYVRNHRLPMPEIEAFAGVLAVLPVEIGNGIFTFSEAGEHAAVFEVLGDDAATSIDLCAVSVADPSRFGVAVGNAAVLGSFHVQNPATWSFDRLLQIYRNPLSWLRGACAGAVVLNHAAAPAVFREALGPLLAEDADHARDLRDLLCAPAVAPETILYRKSSVRRAA